MLIVFLLVPFQRRFHGFFDSFSRSLSLPDFPLPVYFSRKIHLFTSDLFIIALGCILIFWLRTSLRKLFWEGPSKYLTLLFFTFLLSTSLSISKQYSLQYFRLFEFSLVFLFFNCICSLRTKIDLQRFVKRLAWVFVSISLVQCVISICQFVSQDAVGLSFFGEIDPHKFLFHVRGAPNGFLTQLLGPQFNSAELCRACGTFLHPNVLGGFLFCSIMASFYLCVEEVTRLKRLFLQVMILLQFFALYLSFSRAAILALFLSALVWCFLQLKQKSRSRGLAILAGTVVFSALIGAIVLYPQLKARGGIINYNKTSQEADSERLIYMKVAAKMIKEHPLLGVGYNNFQIYSQHEQPRFPHNYIHSKVHNIYLLIASEAGLIGVSIFLLFILAILRAALKKMADEAFQEKAFLFSTFFGFLVIGCCDFYFLENPQGSILFFGIAGLLYGVSSTNKGLELLPAAH